MIQVYTVSIGRTDSNRSARGRPAAGAVAKFWEFAIRRPRGGGGHVNHNNHNNHNNNSHNSSPAAAAAAAAASTTKQLAAAAMCLGNTLPPQIQPPVPSGSAFADETIRRVWCQSPKPEYKSEAQRYGMPARCIPLVRPSVDLIVLPGNHAPTAAAWSFYRDVLGLQDEQVVWTSGSLFNMDDDMSSETVSALEAKMAEAAGASWLLLPYCPTSNFLRWASPLVSRFGGLATIFGETPEWLAEFGDKGLLHRKMSSLETPSVIEEIDATIAVPAGYVCETVEELLAARELMADIEHVCIKPLTGATGVGIVLKPSLEELKAYDFWMGPVNLEEYLDLDVDERGEAVSPVLHYMGNQFCGDFMLDQIMDGCAYSGWSRTAVSEDFQREAVRAMTAFLEHAQPTGAGGVDFLSVDGKPLLTDINTGRFNGAHPSKLFHQAHASPGAEFYCWKLSKPEMAALSAAGMSMRKMWLRMVEEGLAFHPSTGGEGVFPTVALDGMRFQFLAIGTDLDALVARMKALISSCCRSSAAAKAEMSDVFETTEPLQLALLVVDIQVAA